MNFSLANSSEVPSLAEIALSVKQNLSAHEDNVAVYYIGSYEKEQVYHRECDIVVVLDSRIMSEKHSVIAGLHMALSQGSIPKQIYFCNAFIPRSATRPLTIHCAVYSYEELLNRKPRIILRLREQRPQFGNHKLSAALDKVEWNRGGLLTEPWGLLHALELLARGSWVVPQLKYLKGTCVASERVIALANNWNKIEFLWYTASKLTDNLSRDLSPGQSRSLKAGTGIFLEELRGLVSESRNGNRKLSLTKNMFDAWLGWEQRFRSILLGILASS